MVDFKTDFVQTEEDVAQHAELYRGQLAAYSLALERVLEKAVTRKALYFLQAGKNRGNLVISSFFAKTGKNACNLCSDVICLFSFCGVKAP